MEPLKLPPGLIGLADVARLSRELNSLNDFFAGASARPAGTASGQLPKISRLLESLAAENGLNLLNSDERTYLQNSLKVIYDHGPRMHISFAVEPSPKALEKILAWIRQNIHPQALLQIGLQPAIAAGCMMRTTNKVFDMSLRSNLEKQSEYLTQLVRGAVDGR
jgi:F0F1-type ATP synthase delta subunit